MKFRCPACHELQYEEVDAIDVDQLLDCPECRCPLLVSPPADGRGLALAEEAPVQFARRKETSEAEMDMTPMVDVTFLLLIFFMVTAAFALQKSFSMPPPQEEQAAAPVRSIRDFETDPDYVVIRIDEFNTFFVTSPAWEAEREATTGHELLVHLREAREPDSQGRYPTRLLIVADGDCLHEYVVLAMDSGNEVGIQDVSLVTVEGDEL